MDHHAPHQPMLEDIILRYWKNLSPKALAAYTAIHAAAAGQFCDAYQAELAQVSGMSTRHLRRAIEELIAADLVEIQTFYNKAEQKTKNRYILLCPEGVRLTLEPPNRPDNMESHRSEERPDNMESYRSENRPDNMESHRSEERPDIMESHRSGERPDIMESHRPEEQSDSMMSDQSEQSDIMESAMMIHDDVYKGSQKEIMQILDFLHEGERKKRVRQKHVTLDYANRWRAWWNFGQFGRLENPAGFANAQIRQGYEPPGPQFQMPEGRLGDLLDNTSQHNGHGVQAEEEAALVAVGLCPADLVAWQTTLQQLRRQMALATFDQWLRDTYPVRRDEETLIIGVRSEEAKAWLDNRLLEAVARTAAQQDITAFRFEVRGATLAEVGYYSAQ